jgi:NAD(P)-dependent dehydrogenase (short-subunit alcohol dehydrogenase family)
MQLDGRVALVTGSRRIGAVVAAELAKAGADVAIVYRRSQAEADAAAGAVRASGRRALVLQADLRDPDAGTRVVEETAAGLGRLDVLVCLASVYRAVPFDEMTVEVWDEQLDKDLRASFQ